MKHREFFRSEPRSDSAVLLIHGIVGTPNHFVTPIPLMDRIPRDCSVHNLLLPGHGGSVEDFSASSMKEWFLAARNAFLVLAETHERVYIAAHSMGTLFALDLAVEFPEKIPMLYLFAVPMRPHLTPTAMNSTLRLALGKLRPGYPEEAIRKACGTAPTWKLWRYIPWIPRFLELLRKIHETQRKLKDLTVPTVAYQSVHDELVSGASEKVLRKCPVIDVRFLENSTHFHYSDGDLERIFSEFFIDTNKKQHP